VETSDSHGTGIDVFQWACCNPDVVTSSHRRTTWEKLRLTACVNDCSFVELQVILQQIYEAVVYTRPHWLLLLWRRILKACLTRLPWNAARDTQDRYHQQVATLWESATTAVYGAAKHDFPLTFGAGPVTSKYTVTILPDRIGWPCTASTVRKLAKVGKLSGGMPRAWFPAV
jgi:hypothetical protein